jgi:anti-sigma factor RsiW
MNCRSAEDLFSPFLEEELSQAERRELESHLDDCRRCSTAIDELRATVALMGSLPSYETSPHFEEDVMDRIRSGEALRPTLVEWLSQWLAPARLRPVFLTGAAACAAWIAFLIVNPGARQATMLATHPNTQAPAATSAAKPSDAPALPSGSEVIASAPSPAPQVTTVSTPRSGDRGTFRTAAESEVASRSSQTPDSSIGNDATPYQDEYILDQFYLNRSSEDGVHSIVPVTGRPSDDVYITF